MSEPGNWRWANVNSFTWTMLGCRRIFSPFSLGIPILQWRKRNPLWGQTVSLKYSPSHQQEYWAPKNTVWQLGCWVFEMKMRQWSAENRTFSSFSIWGGGGVFDANVQLQHLCCCCFYRCQNETHKSSENLQMYFMSSILWSVTETMHQVFQSWLMPQFSLADRCLVASLKPLTDMKWESLDPIEWPFSRLFAFHAWTMGSQQHRNPQRYQVRGGTAGKCTT